MYSAKARGKNRVEIFAADEHGRVARHRMLEDQLPYALERGEVELAFQPYADLRTGAWIGIEALVQWQHPVLGEVNCRELFMLAERTGQLAGLTGWVLHTIGERRAGLPDLPIGLNVNAGQLLDPRFGGIVLDALTGSGLPADRLILEIVESARMDDEVALDQLRRLAGRGVRIALDDFGGSHVSLGSLGAYPIHQIKVDAAYLTGDPGSLDLVLALAQLLGAPAVVQGVTDGRQLDRLARTSAVGAQGPLLCPIVGAEDLAGHVLGSAHG